MIEKFVASFAAKLGDGLSRSQAHEHHDFSSVLIAKFVQRMRQNETNFAI
jgi:hypothetical protein